MRPEHEFYKQALRGSLRKDLKIKQFSYSFQTFGTRSPALLPHAEGAASKRINSLKDAGELKFTLRLIIDCDGEVQSTLLIFSPDLVEAQLGLRIGILFGVSYSFLIMAPILVFRSSFTEDIK